MDDVLMKLIQIFIILLFLRIAFELLPGWLLAAIFFLVVLSTGLIEPRLVQQAMGSSSGLFAALIPFAVVVVGLWIATAGLGKKRK